jgi:hypothetical protein
MALCLDADFQAPPAPVRACWDCVAGCSVQTLADCQAAGGRWLAQSASCTGNPCGPMGPPANDSCAAVAAGPEIGSGEFLFSNRCATTDGPNPVPSEFIPSGQMIASDIWFKYVSNNPTNCGELFFTTCGTGAEADLDVFLAVYHDSENPTQCVCPDNDNQHALLWPDGLGNNDGCVGFPFGAGAVSIGNVDGGGCFMIRVGGVVGGGHELGEGTLSTLELLARTSCIVSPNWGDDKCIGGMNQNQPCSRHADCPGSSCHTKNRYVSVVPSIVATASGPPTVIQVKAAALPASMSALVGDVWYAGAPVVRPNGPPGGTFKAAQLQCGTADLRDWSTEGLVHFYGAIIVPGATYEVRACTAVDGVCSEPPLTVQTAIFGDVVPPLGIGQPNFIDISAVVTKFQGTNPAAISKTRAQMQPNVLNTSANVNFLDISEVVHAFQGFPYPFPGAACP